MITFKGISANSLGVVVNKLPPFKRATKRTNVIRIDGRDGTIVEELGYDGYVLPIKITLMDVSKVNEVIAWLSGGGVLTTDEDPTRYVTAYIYNEVSYERLVSLKTATVEFYVSDPFRYLTSESNITLTTNGSVTNDGTAVSLPLLKITGTGTVVVTINGRSFTYVFDSTYVYIDSQSMEAYYLTTLKNRKMSGDFPYFDVGLNTITWSGNITELVITKRTRYL
jgi:phage-related protein